MDTVSAADQGANYWSVGDRKAVTLNGTVGAQAINGTYYVYILGFNHNEALEGKGIHFGCFKTALSGGTDICLTDSYYNRYESYNGTKYFQMNHWGNSERYTLNYGGWAACDMRYDILGSTDRAPNPYGSTKTTAATGQNPSQTCATNPVANTLMAALPADLRAVMQPMTKYTDNKGGGSGAAANVTATVDYFPLLAEFEIFGASHYANQYEKNYQAQYDYYAAGNSKKKFRHNDTTYRSHWWTRSPGYLDYNIDRIRFCHVNDSGFYASMVTSYSYGLSPIFKV